MEAITIIKEFLGESQFVYREIDQTALEATVSCNNSTTSCVFTTLEAGEVQVIFSMPYYMAPSPELHALVYGISETLPLGGLYVCPELWMVLAKMTTPSRGLTKETVQFAFEVAKDVAEKWAEPVWTVGLAAVSEEAA